jgi:hypothetical protein
MNTKPAASVKLINLEHTYSGRPELPSATTQPAGLNLRYTYEREGAVVLTPIHAGNYSVKAEVLDSNFSGLASGTLVIKRATVPIKLGGLDRKYTGTACHAVASVAYGLTAHLQYRRDGRLVDAPIDTGNYQVTATVDAPNYYATVTCTMVIRKTQTLAPVPRANGSPTVVVPAEAKANPVASAAPVSDTLDYNGAAVHKVVSTAFGYTSGALADAGPAEEIRQKASQDAHQKAKVPKSPRKPRKARLEKPARKQVEKESEAVAKTDAPPGNAGNGKSAGPVAPFHPPGTEEVGASTVQETGAPAARPAAFSAVPIVMTAKKWLSAFRNGKEPVTGQTATTWVTTTEAPVAPPPEAAPPTEAPVTPPAAAPVALVADVSAAQFEATPAATHWPEPAATAAPAVAPVSAGPIPIASDEDADVQATGRSPEEAAPEVADVAPSPIDTAPVGPSTVSSANLPDRLRSAQTAGNPLYCDDAAYVQSNTACPAASEQPPASSPGPAAKAVITDMTLAPMPEAENTHHRSKAVITDLTLGPMTEAERTKPGLSPASKEHGEPSGSHKSGAMGPEGLLQPSELASMLAESAVLPSEPDALSQAAANADTVSMVPPELLANVTDAPAQPPAHRAEIPVGDDEALDFAPTSHPTIGSASQALEPPITAVENSPVVQVDARIVIEGRTVTYDEKPHPATGRVTGVGADENKDLMYLLGLYYKSDASTLGLLAPVEVGNYQVWATFVGNDYYKAVGLYDTGKRIVIEPSESSLDFDAPTAAEPALPASSAPSVVSASSATSTPATDSQTSAPALASTGPAVTAFSALTDLQVPRQTGMLRIAGKITAGGAIPSGSVSITINFITHSAPILRNGSFSATGAFNTVSLEAGTYPIVFRYEGNADFPPATGSSTLTITEQQRSPARGPVQLHRRTWEL